MNVSFEISTSEIEYMQNFVEISKLILFGLQYPHFGHLGSKFWTANVRFEITIFETVCMSNLKVKIRKLIPFGPKSPNLAI